MVGIHKVDFTAHSLRSLKAQRTQRILTHSFSLSPAQWKRDVNRGEKE